MTTRAGYSHGGSRKKNGGDKLSKRFFDTEMLDDPWILDLPIKLKMFWIFICLKADNAGIWKVNWKAASFYIGEDIEPEAAAEIMGDRIKIINNGKQWWIRGLPKFQSGALLPGAESGAEKSIIEKLEKAGLFDEYWNSLDKSDIKVKLKKSRKWNKEWAEKWDDLNKSEIRLLLDQDRTTGSPKEKDKIKEKKKEKNKIVTAEYTPEFNQFWQAYPLRKGKGNAFASWKSAVKVAEPDEITEKAKHYAAECRKLERPKDKIAHPSTWLNQRRWEDDYDLPPPEPQRQKQYATPEEQRRHRELIQKALRGKQ